MILNGRIFAFVGGFILVALVARADVGLGENVLLNPGFTAMPGQPPTYWDVRKFGDLIKGANALEPGGMPAVTITGCSGNNGFDLHQYGLRLMAGGRYRLSAKVRVKGFQTEGKHGFRVCNEKWRWSAGFDLPRGTRDWQLMTKEFIAEKSLGTYYVVIYTTKSFSGEIEVADAKLEALDEDTCRNTHRSELAKVMTMPRLVPCEPLLNEIPESRPEVSFRFFGTLPSGLVADYDVCVTCGENKQTVPLSENAIRVSFRHPAEKGQFTASIVRRKDGINVFSRTYDYALRNDALKMTQGRRLNNLVTEYVNEELKCGTACKRRLVIARRAWFFISAEATDVSIDGKTVISPETPRHETFRELERGEHVISVFNSAGGPFVVRGIPELLNYSTSPSVVKENLPFDWPFFEKYVFSAVTTFNGGNTEPAKIFELRKRGYTWLGNVHSTSLGTDDEIVRRLTGTQRIDAPYFDGATCDEQYLALPEVMSHYAAGMWKYVHPENKRVYSWIVGTPSIEGIDHDVIAASVNATQGQGKLLTEYYLATCPTEAEAASYLRQWIRGSVSKYEEFSPVFRPKYGVILGNYTQSPGLSLWGHPEVDFRYYLDMQFNLIANDPMFEDIGCTGVWGSHRAEEEIHRWTFMLMRHYFVEGRREMLSPKYGFRYLSGHLANGDFAQGLDKWKTMGNVSLGRRKGLGAESEGRRCKDDVCGDTFAVLHRSEDGVSTLSQVMKDLVPGRSYCLRYAVLNAKEIEAGVRGKPCEHPLWAVLPDDFKVCEDLSWSHVDLSDENHGPRVNMRHVVFVAGAKEAEVLFTNEQAGPGEDLALNCVSIHPYLPR